MRVSPVIACIAGIAMLSATQNVCDAQPYPTGPVRLLVGGAPGSVPDVMIRPIAERLAVRLGHPVLVDNRPGAAGAIAMSNLVSSPPDGHTLALATMSQATASLELGRISARLEHNRSQVFVSKSAPPIKPVNSGSTRSTVPMDQMQSMHEYNRARDSGRQR